MDHILLFIPGLELHGHFLCFKLKCKRPDLAPEKRGKYILWGCENPTQTRTRRRILVRNDSGLATLWCTGMKAGNDVRIRSSVSDARSGRQASFGTPQLEYQIVALVRLNRPPTNAVSRLPCCEQINEVDTSTSSTTRSGSWRLTWILFTPLEIGRPSVLAGLSTLRFQIRLPDATYAVLVSGAYPIARTGELR